ncbi:hypothetical protein HYALB_00007660, partial [Hymenoscyphus albidus]
NPPPDRIMRPIHSSGPVEDIEISDIQCGGYAKGGMVGSRPANLTAGPVAAGEIVRMFWDLWPDSHVGPALDYMARCANDDCKTFMPGTDAVWFKIKHAGRGGTSNVWTDVTPLMKPGGVYEYTIPPCLQAGSYLVRHELIALFGAEKYPGAQFYPSCHQIQVTGGGSSTGPAKRSAFRARTSLRTRELSSNNLMVFPGNTRFQDHRCFRVMAPPQRRSQQRHQQRHQRRSQ